MDLGEVLCLEFQEKEPLFQEMCLS